MLSVILPIFNEGAHLEENLEELLKELGESRIAFEIILVNDGSTDLTSQVLSEIESNYRNRFSIKIISHPHNLGYGAAIKSGIRHSEFSTLAITDADMTYAPADLLKLFNIFNEKNLDMVVGLREGSNYRESFKKSMLRFLLRRLVEFVTKREIPDINSGCRVFKKDIAIDNLALLSDKFSFTTSITLAFMMRNAFVRYEPISYNVRQGSSKVRLISDSVRTLGFVLTVSLFFNPLRIFIPVGVAFFLLSAFFSTILAFTNMTNALISFVIALSALGITISLGLVGQLLGDRLKDSKLAKIEH